MILFDQVDYKEQVHHQLTDVYFELLTFVYCNR